MYTSHKSKSTKMWFKRWLNKVVCEHYLRLLSRRVRMAKVQSPLDLGTGIMRDIFHTQPNPDTGFQSAALLAIILLTCFWWYTSDGSQMESLLRHSVLWCKVHTSANAHLMMAFVTTVTLYYFNVVILLMSSFLHAHSGSDNALMC